MLREDMETEGVSEDHHEAKKDITSFGVKIDTGQIKPIPLDQQESELQALGVNVYEQDDFEQSVINQVDSYLQEKETEIATRALEKELKDIRDDLCNTEKELKTLEDSLKEFGDGKPEDYDERRRKEALSKQKDNKENQYKKLKAREKYAIKRLSDKINLVKELRSQTSVFQSERQHYNTAALTEQREHWPTSDSLDWSSAKTEGPHEEEDDFSAEYQNELFSQQLYDVVKGRKRSSRIDVRDSDSIHDSDEDFVPDAHADSSEEDDAARIEFERNKRRDIIKPKRKKLSKPHQKLRTTLSKKRESKKSGKVVDDGNDEAFFSRMRLLKLKERLREKGEWDSSYAESLSDDGLEDDGVTVPITTSFKVPSRIWNRLYKYQKTGVKWLWELHSQQAGGIIGDEMGLGKTIQVIGLLAGLSVSKIGRYASGRVGLGPVLIACPATVLHQWVKELHRWWPRFRVAVLHETGSYSGKKELLIRKMVRSCAILVTSYSNMRIHQDELHGHGWDYIILDEGHKIRNPDADITLAVKQFSTPHRIILSGSPMQNNLKELWSLIDFVFPGKLGTLPVFMAEFSVPITIGGYANATDVQVQTAYKCACILRDTINPYLLRRLKKDVKANLELPSKNEQVLFCRLTDEQVKLYKLYLDSREVGSILANRMKVFPGLIMLRKICNHPDLSSTAGSLEWMKEKAQNYRRPDVERKTVDEIEYEGGYGYWKRSGKLVVTEALLRLWKQQGHRVLLFSQTKQMLDILEAFVKNQGYKYQRMDGSTPIGSRQPAVDTFNKDSSIFVYLLTTRVGGLGLNLIGADRIIIYDPDWNPSTDTQARERSWRIGQDKHVTIYRLLTTGTIEEKIYHRQIFKQFLANRVLTNPMQRRFFKSNDLFELFTLGDTRPNQGTETSAIFAGTGSEVKVKRKQDKFSGCMEPLPIPKRDSGLVKNKTNRKRASTESASSRLKTSDAWTVTSRDMADVHPEKSIRGGTMKSEFTATPSRPSVENTDGVKEETLPAKRITPNVNVNKSMDENPAATDCANAISDMISSISDPQCTSQFTTATISSRKDNELDTKDNQMPLSASVAKVDTALSFNDAEKRVANKAQKKLKRRKKKKDAKVDGIRIKNLDRRDIYNRRPDNEVDESSESQTEKSRKHDEEILTSLFRSSGVHSALKHDKIEDPSNPDFVLVEKEAERVAKQAVSALRLSRQECRKVTVGVPTWTGNQGAAGRPGSKPRFGLKKSVSKVSVKDNSQEPKSVPNSDSDSDENTDTVFTGSGLLGKKKTEGTLSSSNLLAKMKKRNPKFDLTTENNFEASVDTNIKTEENKLVEDIRDFVAYSSKTFGQASTREILDKFQSRIDANKSALFRELLKQVCYFRKVDGAGTWFLKEEYR